MIPFSKVTMSGRELEYVSHAILSGEISGDQNYTKLCTDWMNEVIDGYSLITPSCTAALEMAAILSDIKEGDEVIMPSYTFVSTANAFVLRGATPVFVDIQPDTQNLDASLIVNALTKKTKAIVPVHYAGVSCDMDSISKIAIDNNILIIEDAAQAILSKYKGEYVGAKGDFSCFSFHATKNITAGEAGAIVINNKKFVERAEIIREKGTNRSQFLRGTIDKYTWRDVGSSYLPSDLVSACLYGQFENAINITNNRLMIWNKYHELFASLEAKGVLSRPRIPSECEHNGHIYYVILDKSFKRDVLIKKMRSKQVICASHYECLHKSEPGIKYGKTSGLLLNTENTATQIIRFPIWIGLTMTQIEEIVEKFTTSLSD
jgi:dTDP-4-amino-4,6-dideoxygalactose transaminase